LKGQPFLQFHAVSRHAQAPADADQISAAQHAVEVTVSSPPPASGAEDDGQQQLPADGQLALRAAASRGHVTGRGKPSSIFCSTVHCNGWWNAGNRTRRRRHLNQMQQR